MGALGRAPRPESPAQTMIFFAGLLAIMGAFGGEWWLVVAGAAIAAGAALVLMPRRGKAGSEAFARTLRESESRRPAVRRASIEGLVALASNPGSDAGVRGPALHRLARLCHDPDDETRVAASAAAEGLRDLLPPEGTSALDLPA